MDHESRTDHESRMNWDDRVTVWDDRLTPAERAALAPGRPEALDRSPDVLIVGGGVVGLAIAIACRRAGLGRVTVVERAPRLAYGASGANGGAIAPDMHLLTDSPEFVAFGRSSRELYRRWDAEWDGALGLWPTRWLNIFPPGAAPHVSRQAPGAAITAAAAFTELDPSAVRELEPDVRVPDGGTALLVDGQLGVNPQRLSAALASRAGQVITGVRVLGVAADGSVDTSDGRFTPGAVVFATGLVPRPWADGVRQRWAKGHMASVAPGPWRLGSVLAGPVGGGTPLADGSVVCGGTFDEDTTTEVRPELSDGLAADLVRVLPAAAGARVSHRWCCLRPWIEGRQPVIDRLPGLDNGWFAGGHFTTGVMMAAATGAAVADWIGGSAVPAGIETFTLPVG
ncbi:NAD(P)/FAD-dependent oxidoreductase [Hamadaea tsunoensis]|uniref:NAD(P)/FAD-dependent oxidoreductase n=1 Tax=Hamadaea tsunoensis TaxID=53368 RepID=UPI0003FCE1A8|nr:FAD-dependent oxidoreductase [Hamadaea tsunoensis]